MRTLCHAGTFCSLQRNLYKRERTRGIDCSSFHLHDGVRGFDTGEEDESVDEPHFLSFRHRKYHATPVRAHTRAPEKFLCNPSIRAMNKIWAGFRGLLLSSSLSY